MYASTARTTINLPADLLQEAKIFAAQNQTTLTHLITQGLSKVVGHTKDVSKKSTLTEYLKTFKPYPKLSDAERERRYREAMLKKHG